MTEPLLSIGDLAVSYRTASGVVPALRAVNLDVHSGEIMALVGESGSGKSTLAHAVLGLLPRGGSLDGGSLRFEGTELSTLPERALRAVRGAGIALVPQDPVMSLDPVKKVGDQVAEVLLIHGIEGRRGARAAAAELLARAGIDHPESRAGQYPHELSGGLRQRVLIAIALAARPRLIIADEPTSALDVTVQQRILDHLHELAAASNTAILLVTHDLGVAADRAQRVAVMSKGRIVEQGGSRSLLAAPAHDYTRGLLAAAPSLTGLRLRPEREGTEPLVEATGLVKTFTSRSRSSRRDISAVDDVSLRIPKGTTLALVGESGSGKSTTARLLLGLERPRAGTVSFGGTDVTSARGERLRALRGRMQLIYQNPYASLNPRHSVGTIVAEPLRAFGIGNRSEREARARDALDAVTLGSSMARRRPAELSGGQRQRVAIARALVLRPEFVVCDEPVSALDVSVQARILELLVRVQEEFGLTYLFISHDLAVVRQIADQVVVMRAGKVEEAGSASEVLGAPRSAYTRQLLAAIPGRRVGEEVR
ncbi:ABC transporter ATP-binding protein [Prauserella marina]|nr:ABC transporter ATP-binding protein [Prauserella marina]ASR36374.1 ABC transporter ATP-binding protein [Prauserella marina]